MDVAEEEEVSMEGEQKGGASGGVRDGEVRTAAAAAAVSLETLRKRMADFATERDWEQFHSPRNLLLALVRLLHFSSLAISLSPILENLALSSFGDLD
jgi:dCTP diphosphatase